MQPLKKLTSTNTSVTPWNIRLSYFDNVGKEKEGFTLNPPYQRNVVWETKQHIKFIESVFYGIVPSPIVLAIDSKNNTKICVDGKQRLTCIIKFFINNIPYHVIESSKIVLYWYTDAKEDKSIQKILEEIYQIKNFENKLITPQMKCWIENEIQLSVVQYIDITYEQQIDIFNRLQYGMTISRGSYLKSFIQDAKLCECIVNASNKYNKYFDKYVKNVNNEDHIRMMIELFLMLEKEIVSIKSETVDYELKKMTMKSFDKLDKKYENLMKIMFDSQLLNQNEFKQKKVIIGCLLYAKEKLDSNTFDKEKMKNVLEKIYYEITEEKVKFKFDELTKFINDNWDIKKNKKIFKSVSVKKIINKSISKKNVQSKSDSLNSNSNSSSEGDSDDETDDTDEEENNS